MSDKATNRIGQQADEQSDLHPALVDLVRLLARSAARADFATAIKEIEPDATNT